MSGATIYIVSGEGEQGHREVYTGTVTPRAIRARLTRERCSGDRWAHVEIDGERVGDEELDSALEVASRAATREAVRKLPELGGINGDGTFRPKRKS